MSVLNRIACLQGRRDDVPNQELARDLAATHDRDGIREIAENLHNDNRRVQADCLKTLYEIGYLEPGLSADYTGDFLALLGSGNNRLVWGAMIALSTVAPIRPDDIDERREAIERAMAKGSVITVDNGIKVLAVLASTGERRRAEILP